MASNQENINIKATLDTTQFDNSLRGMQQEIKALNQVPISVLSDAEKAKIQTRIAELRKGIRDLKQEQAALAAETPFVTLNNLITPLAGAFTAAAGALSLFGVENEKLNKILQSTQALTVGLMALNQLRQLDEQKLAALELVNRTKKLILDKLIFKQTVQQTVAETAGANAKKLSAIWTNVVTKAQWAWNAAITANPIGALIVAVAALVTGIILLVKWLNKQGETQQEVTKAYDGTIIANKELLDQYNEYIKTLSDLELEYAVLTGRMTENEAAIAGINQELEYAITDINNKYVPLLNELNEKYSGFWRNLWAGIKGVFIGQQNAIIQQTEKFLDEYGNVIDQKNAEIERATNIANQRRKNEEQRQTNERIKAAEQEKNKIVETIKRQFEEVAKLYEDNLKNLKDILGTAETNLDSLLQQWILLEKGVNEYDKRLLELQFEQENFNKSIDEQIAAFEKGYNALKKQSQQAFDYIQQLKAINAPQEVILEAQQRYLTLLQQEGELYKLLEEKGGYLTAQKQVKEKIVGITREQILKDKQLADAQEKLNQMYERFNSILKRTDLQLQLVDLQMQQLQESNDKIRKSLTDKELEEIKKGEEEKLKIQMDALKQYYQAKIDLANASGEYSEAELLTAQMDDAMNKLEENFTQRWKNISDTIKQQLIELTGAVASTILDIFEQDTAAKFQLLNEKLQEEINTASESLDKLRDANLISEEEYENRQEELDAKSEKRQKDLKIRQAKAEKKYAIFQILIDTAMAVAKSWGQGGGLLGLPLAALAAAQGALQLALVASQPIPEFAKGGKIGGRKHALGGTVIEAEQGEFVVNRSSVSQPGVEALLNLINRPQQNPQGTPLNTAVNSDQNIISQIVSETVKGISAIPVINVETDFTRVQRKVSTIEARARW